MRGFLVGAILIAGAASASACEPPVIMIGADGRPEYISPNRDVTAELESMFGPAPSEGAIMVISARERSGQWLPSGSRLGPHDVALLFGANADAGFLYTGPDECAPPDLPLDPLLPEKPPGLPEDLFPDEPALGTQPRSGLWQARLGETRLEGCPPMIASAFAQSPGALPAEWLAPRALSFGRPFHPDQLEMSRTLAGEGLGAVNWSATGPATWTAKVMPEIFGQIPAGQGGGSKMTWTMTVIDADRIDHAVVLDIVFPPEAAQVLGGKGCAMTTDNQWIRVGP